MQVPVVPESTDRYSYNIEYGSWAEATAVVEEVHPNSGQGKPGSNDDAPGRRSKNKEDRKEASRGRICYF